MTDLPTGTVTFLFSDVVGSSPRWESDHDSMAGAMATHDDLVGVAIESHGGHVVKHTGDGIFAVFMSAFGALDGSLALRESMAAWPSESDPIGVRIGLHTGEAELRANDYFGSTVNRAARIMSMAEGGQILISRATQEVVRDRLPDGVALHDRGEVHLEGLARPEHVFWLSSDSEEPEPGPGDPEEEVTRAAWIAVLPFENLSSDPDQEFLADGLTEDITTALAAYRSLRVIARTSTVRLKGTARSIPEIASDLGVRFVLEGSVRRAGSRLRVTAQLIEAETRHHVWAERFDVEIEDIFDLQDQLSRGIVVAIDPAIRLSDAIQADAAGQAKLDAWGHVARGLSELWRYRAESKRRAMAAFERAIELDQGYSEAHSGLSWAYFSAAWLPWADDREAAADRAHREAKRAIELDPLDASGHAALAFAHYAAGRMDGTISAADRAVELNPSAAYAHLVGGIARAHGGTDPEGGLGMVHQAIALSPRDPMAAWFHGGAAIANFILGRYEEAAKAGREAAVRLRYGYLFGRVVLTSSSAHLGDVPAAERELAEMLTAHPDFAPSFLDPYVFSDGAVRHRLIDGLRLAGLRQ